MTSAPENLGNKNSSNILQWFLVILLIYILLCAVGTIGSGFKLATGGKAKELFEFASNPFLALLIGTVATALIQSSSTVTSIIVGLVAGGMPVSVAVPMVMGANIGTTITNTIVSLGHIRSKEDFRRSFAAATVHDFFNWLSVLIFLPLEIMTGFLQKSAGYLAEIFVGGAAVDVKSFNFMKAATKPVVNTFKDIGGNFNSPYDGVFLIIFGIILIFITIMFIGKLLKILMVGRAKKILNAAIGRGPVTGVFSGTAVTVLVQSSSTSTSLMVPLAGSGIFSIRQIYPFTLGANIGTCVTALLAATAISGSSAIFALQIALVHLLYNVIAVIVIYAIPFLRNTPIWCANKLADVAADNKALALGYIGFMFFVFPGLCVWLFG